MNDDTQTLADKYWKKLFDKYKILQTIDSNGFFSISANQINEFREARLMTKFDHRVNLPHLFRENRLSILPVTRGDYIISHSDAYQKFNPIESAQETQGECVHKTMNLPNWIQSLDYNDISSETIALNTAFAAGIFSDFLEDELLTATASGRMKSGIFDFYITDSSIHDYRSIHVENSQIEVDAAYEGCASLALIEAKCNLADDFLVRQLYYPFRLWNAKITKPIRPIFFVYSNGTYRLYEYQFEHTEYYNSLQLIKHVSYTIEDTDITTEDIQGLLHSIHTQEDPDEIPFPQADKFERIINLCELLKDQTLTKMSIAEEYAFTLRQADYYTNAALYLGLLKKNVQDKSYELTDRAERILALPYKRRQLAYARSILEHRAFFLTLTQYFSTGELPDKNSIVEYMKSCGNYHLDNESTWNRRATTIVSWINWIVGLIH